jgi:hypothetical protein
MISAVVAVMLGLRGTRPDSGADEPGSPSGRPGERAGVGAAEPDPPGGATVP